MEKFYIVDEETRLYKSYILHLKYEDEIKKIYKQLQEEYCFKSKYFYYSKDELAVTEVDKTIEAYVSKKVCDGLRFFRKNSVVMKRFNELRKDLKYAEEPWLPFYFRDAVGKTRSRVFMIDHVLYCSFGNSEVKDFKNPEGFREIKASEFYKVIEDDDESIKGGELHEQSAN